MKTRIALAWFAIAGSGLLSGCSSSVTKPQDDPIVSTLTGQPSTFAEQKLGLPNKRNETKSGAQVWEYLDGEKGMMATDCSVTLSIRNDVIEHVFISSEKHSLVSTLATPCKNIRAALGKS